MPIKCMCTSLTGPDGHLWYPSSDCPSHGKSASQYDLTWKEIKQAIAEAEAEKRGRVGTPASA